VPVPDSPSRCLFSDVDGRLHVAGELDAHSAPDLSDKLGPLLGEGDVHLDLSAVEFMDSSGLRVVVDAHQRATAAGAKLIVHDPSKSVRRIIEISGLADHLNLA
jgi:anti-sigma B factor antagonist